MHHQFTKDFNSEEFDSPDMEYSGLKMHPLLIAKLQKMRNDFKKPIIINSGYRTIPYNKSVGGKSNSSHLRGLAVDLKCKNSIDRLKLIQLALKVGFNRVGVHHSFIHLDIDNSKPKGVMWVY